MFIFSQKHIIFSTSKNNVIKSSLMTASKLNQGCVYIRPWLNASEEVYWGKKHTRTFFKMINLNKLINDCLHFIKPSHYICAS